MAAVISLLGNGVVAYHPRLVTITGSASAALMLSQALYWTRMQAHTASHRDGWFWKTHDEWTRETALSRHEQATARKRMLGLTNTFWFEERRGMPAKIWFRVDVQALANTLDNQFAGRWDWSDQALILQLLGRPTIVYRRLANVCGSVSAALLASRLLSELRVATRKVSDPIRYPVSWLPLRPDHLMTATGLTRSEFYTARKKLRSAALLHDRREGVPPRASWRLDLDQLASLLTPSQASSATPDMPVASQSAGIDTPSLPDLRRKHAGFGKQECGNPHTDCPDSGRQDFRNPADMTAGIDTPSQPDSRFLYKGLTTNTLTTSNPPLASPPIGVGTEQPVRGGGFFDNLVWPNKLFLEGELETVRTMVLTVPDVAQDVLDELAGHASNGLVRNPLAYLRRLVLQAQTGQFVPVIAARVAARRLRTAQHATARDASVKAVQDAATAAGSALTDEQRAARRAELSALRWPRRAISDSSTGVHTVNAPHR